MREIEENYEGTEKKRRMGYINDRVGYCESEFGEEVEPDFPYSPLTKF